MSNSALIRKAIQSGSVEDLKHVIETVPYQVLSETGYTPLMLAIHLGPTIVKKDEVFKMILDWEPDINRKDIDGYSAFSYATSLHRIEFIKILLERDVDVNVPCITTVAPHFRAYDAYKNSIHSAHTLKYPISTRHQMSPLSMAIYRSYDYLVPIMVEKGADLNAVGGLDITPLSMAVRSQKDDMVGYLLECGADPNVLPKNWREYAQNPKDVCPVALKKAIKYGEATAISLLIQAGSNVPSLFPRKDNLYSTPLTYLFSQPVAQLSEPFTCFSMLREYCKITDFDSLKRSPLSYAVENHIADYVLPYLFDEKVNNSPDVYHVTPMMYAYQSRYFKAMDMLYHQGVPMANQMDTVRGRNLLMHSLSHNDVEMVNFLLQYNPNLLQKDKKGRTILYYVRGREDSLATKIKELYKAQSEKIVQHVKQKKMDV